MKTTKTTLTLFLILVSFTHGAHAEEPTIPGNTPGHSMPAGEQPALPAPGGSPTPPGSVPLPQPGGAPTVPGGPVPNQRELSEQDYAWLGHVVWSQMQLMAGRERPNLGEADIRALIDEMRRNRNEVNLTLDELYALMSSPALCGGGKPALQPAPGVDVDRAGKFLERLFR